MLEKAEMLKGDGTKLYENSCGANLMDTGVWYCDFGHCKPKTVQNMTEVIAVGYLATKRQI